MFNKFEKETLTVIMSKLTPPHMYKITTKAIHKTLYLWKKAKINSNHVRNEEDDLNDGHTQKCVLA